MNILADRHHSGLYHSLQLLAQRLGAELFTPYGQDWWDEWYWSFGRSTYGDDRLARQFLLDREHYDSEFPDALIRRVTLAEARRMDWAYVIASVPRTTSPASRSSPPSSTRRSSSRSATRASRSSGAPPDRPRLLRDADRGAGPHATTRRWTRSLHRTAGLDPHRGLVRQLHALDGRLLRPARPGGGPHPHRDLRHRRTGRDHQAVRRPRESHGAGRLGLARQGTGDGFGHVIHTWAAVGRPIIGHASHYAGQLGECFWQDGVTCIDLDRHPVDEAVALIREIR
jgi:hypothetical protein